MAWRSIFRCFRRPPQRTRVLSESVDSMQYGNDFGFKEFADAESKDDTILARALAQAFDARKFEIEMYWKRATYFWAFIAASFVGFATFYNSGQGFSAVLMANVGLLFSVAWHFVNRGSKAWQENWENHVELLEDRVIGPLYKTSARRPSSVSESDGRLERWITSPLPISVSKINTISSAYVVIIWFILLILSSISCWRLDYPSFMASHLEALRAIAIVGVTGVTAIFLGLFFLEGKSHLDGHNPVLSKRKTTVFVEEKQAKSQETSGKPD